VNEPQRWRPDVDRDGYPCMVKLDAFATVTSNAGYYVTKELT